MDSRLFKGMIGASMIFAAGMVMAQTMTFDNVDSWLPNKNLTAKDGALEVKNAHQMLRSKELIPIDPAKTYQLSASFKAADGTAPSLVYFGFEAYDANKRAINIYSINPVKDTDTELAEAVKKTDTVIKIKDGSKWKALSYYVTAFNTDPSLSDLPNSNLVVSNPTKVEKKDGYWEITLNRPAGKDIPADTKVRQMGGGGYIYTAYGTTTPDWKVYPGMGFVKGVAKSMAYRQWWKGTAYARVIVLANWQKPADAAKIPVLEIKDAKLEIK